MLVARLSNDSGSGQGQTTNNDKIGKEQILAGLSDWKIWAATLVFWGNTVGVYGYVFFPSSFPQEFPSPWSIFVLYFAFRPESFANT